MALEPSIAVFDSCILYPFHLRNIIVQAAVDRLVEARWTDEIIAAGFLSRVRSPATAISAGGERRRHVP